MKKLWTVVYYWRGERHRAFYPDRAAAVAALPGFRAKGFTSAYVSEW